MELHDFAERVLFATTLEEKLSCPANITDERPGSSLVAPETPGRPTELRFKAQGSGKAEFPGAHHLERTEERGRLLHFFANHELLATELMALVLLRFPDAPAAFRHGVLQTLKDEQEHTRLYIQRMKECGIQFGELPVSGYFWRSVSIMENPMDYVSSLSLTFEQANLDFARHFARSFAVVGDADTAKLLEKIYHDEIGHVAYGLKWFRRWKNPDESDWEAFCRQLKFPLSPQRAKGFALNVEGRRAAGMDSAFIAELDVFSQSKGRTPTVGLFNPFAEGRIAQGKAFNLTKHQAQLQSDLENLPQFLCRQDDIVLVQRRPSVEFLSDLKQAGFDLPEFVELESDLQNSRSAPVPGRSDAHLFDDVESSSDFVPLPRLCARGRAHSERVPKPFAKGKSALESLSGRKLGRLRPWAWAPDSVEILEPCFAHLTAEKRTGDESFNPRIAQLYSKAWSAAFLKRVLSTIRRQSAADILSAGETGHRSESRLQAAGTGVADSKPDALSWLCSENDVGIAVNTVDEALQAIAAIRQRGHHKIVLKQALGLAGGNAIRLFEPELLDAQRRWIESSLKNRGQLVVEPWLQRVRDFSVQLEMTSGGLKLCGFVGLMVDPNGQYLGNWAAPQFERRIPSIITDALNGPPDKVRRIQDFYSEIFKSLESELRDAKYYGPVGIDAFTYQTATGECRLKPIVEINPRYTMGRVLVELMKRVAPGRYATFRLISRKMVAAAGLEDFTGYARFLQERWPLKLEGEPVPRIQDGALCLNEPARAQVALAVIQVGTSCRGFP